MNLKEQNILFFTRSMGLGGTENVILQLCEILHSRVNKIIVCSAGGVNVEKLEKMGVKHVQIGDIDHKSIFTVLKTLKILKKILKQEKISVVHTHHRMAAFYIFILSYFFRFTFLASVHGEFYDKKLFTKIAYSRAKVVACGNMVKKNVNEFFGITKNVIVLRNAVERDQSPINEIPKISTYREKGYKIVGYIGRLSEEKGVLYLINSLKYFSKEDKVVYVIAGDGPLRDEMDQLLTRIHRTEKAMFLGYRSDPQNVIRQVDCVVLPSLTEGLPLTPIEAFAQGKPVIASSVGGTVEIVKDHKNGILIRPKKSNEIEEAIKELLFDSTLYVQCSQNARKDYDTKFSMDIFKNNVLKIYEGL